VSLEGPNNLEELLDKAEVYRTWGTNFVIKVPMLGNGDGLRAVRILNGMGVPSNVTACMTLNQTFLCANAGATFVSLFYNRMKDMKGEQYAIDTIKKTMDILRKGGFETELIVGSIRSPDDIPKILEGEPNIITIPTKILEQMPFCQKTEDTLVEFEGAWKKYLKHEKKK
jgi:transaldolase